MKQFWLVRHGESQSQTGEVEDGRNPGLSALGRRQAARLSEPLRDLAVDAILLSPLQRAWQTYQLARVSAPTVEFDSRLAESNWGRPDYYRPILPLSTPTIAAPDRHDAWLQPVEQRVTALMADLMQRPEERVLLFGHWGVFGALFRVFVGLAAGDDLRWATMDNTGISLLEQGDDQRRYLRFWNARPHWSADF